MPFTPYHFGPSGALGLIFRKWIDIPVFVLANAIVDVEILFHTSGPCHQQWHWHTLLVGAAVGLGWGLLAYPLRGIFEFLMQLIRLPYKTSLLKMTASGILGVWLHVLIDAVYHPDVQILWPNRRISLYGYITKPNILLICKYSFAALAGLYIITLVTSALLAHKKPHRKQKANENRNL